MGTTMSVSSRRPKCGTGDDRQPGVGQHHLTVWRVRALPELGTIDLLRDGNVTRPEAARDLSSNSGRWPPPRSSRSRPAGHSPSAAEHHC